MIYTGSLQNFLFLYWKKKVLTIKCQKKLRLKVILPNCGNVFLRTRKDFL